MSHTEQRLPIDSSESKFTGSKDIKCDQDNKEPREDTLKSVALFFLENCTAHGLPRIAVERSTFRKILWGIIFAGALGYFCYTLQSIISTFLKYEVNVNTMLHSRDRVVFPAVTVCNMNRLRRSNLKGTQYESILNLDDTYNNKIDPSYKSDFVHNKFLVDPSQGGYANIPTYYDSDYDVENSISGIQDYEYDVNDPLSIEVEPFKVDDSEIYHLNGDYDFPGFLKGAKTNDYSDLQDILRPNRTEYDQWGHMKDQLIVQCSFDRSNCNASDFSQIYSTAYGNCYTFNSALDGKRPKYTSRYGSVYGLRLTLNIEFLDYLGMFTQEIGIRVSVHHPNVFPFPESNGYSAPVGLSTSLGISTTLVKRKPFPYKSNCANEGEHKLFYNGSYTLENCQLSCYRKELLRRCNCVDTVLNTLEEPRCGYVNITQVVCRQKVKYNYLNQDIPCLDDCTEPCWSMTFGAEASYMQWPNERYAYFLVDKLRSVLGDQNMTLLHVKENMARVHVYMNTFQLLAIVESPANTWYDLLADCGGTLGLFIGLSVCTALEFLELIMDCVIVLMKKCCKRDRNVTRPWSMQVKPASNNNPV